jgi:lipoprotein-anchoring transpeptidase ErfK/SrfK
VRVVDGQVEPLPALKGRVLDTAATLAWLQEHPWEVFAERRLPLVVRPVDPAVTDVSPVIDQVSQLLTAPLTVRLYDPIADEHREWTIPPAVIGDWFVFEVDPADATRLTWRLDPARIEPFLATQSATLGAERFVDPQTAIPLLIEAVANRQPEVKLRIAHPARRHIVKSGETISSIAMDYGIPYPWIEQANPDLGATLFAGQVITIPSPDLLIPLPVVEGKRIVVSISQQRVWVYENGALKWEWPASTGIDSSPTSPGVFQVQTHELNAYASNWNLWMPYFIGIYRPVPTSDFMNGFHGFPSREGSQILWTRNLGSPITYGCILVSTENAKLLFDWAEPGVIVDVRR